MKTIDLMYRTMLAELGQRALDARFKSDFPLSGRFVPVTVKEREYWYFDQPTEGGNKRTYVGPKSDEDITRRVEAFRDIKDDFKARRKLVSTLTRDAGMVAPERLAGDIVEVLAAAGLFRLRAVLIGTVAFQCYAGVLGVRLPAASMQTGDADFAQDYGISASVEDSLPPILDLLQSVDSSFRGIPHQSDNGRVTAFENATRYRVEFLTGNRGSDDYVGRPSDMPALGGASADNLRFLDFLIRDPIRTILLHKSGISVLVPSPERFAIHKLIVATRRRKSDLSGHSKQDKDVLQASLLIEAMIKTRRQGDLAEAYCEAWQRGQAWQAAIGSGMRLMSADQIRAFSSALTDGIHENGDNPAEYGLPF